MPDLATQLPARRADLVIRPIGEGGRYVVKIPGTNDYFHLGDEEHFLLGQLDGRRDADAVCEAFEERFGGALSADDLDGFVEMARTQGLLQEKVERGRQGEGEEEIHRHVDQAASSPPRLLSPSPALKKPPKPKQSLLYWRKSVFDPDALFNWLEPKIRFCWTRGFLIFSAACIVLATIILWSGRQEAISSFQNALRWETVVLAWLTMILVGTLHECGHGLTCKHYGGEVHEIGFLLLFFMPGFYCNVSDAWLFREKSKRLWVTFAGGYFELFLWALAVFVWRITVPDSLINYLAFIVLTLSGIDSFFNFNPLIKLDGYYLLSDAVEIPNLRQRSFDYTMSRLRWLLWGAAKPERNQRGRFLLGFGLTSWLYSLTFLGLMIFAMSRFVGNHWGPAGFAAVAIAGVISMKGLFKGVSSGEANAMILTRHKRTLCWFVGLAALATAMCLVKIDDRAGGPCEIRAALRAEVRAPLAGFLREVYVEQGDHVSPGMPVARLEIPDLESRLTQKQAEEREAEAQVRLLEIGPRPEKVAEQRRKIQRAEAWRDLASHDLGQLRLAHQEDLNRLDQKTAEHRAELDAAQDDYNRAETLFARKALTEDQLRDLEHQVRVARARLAHAEANRRAVQAEGILAAEAELAHRKKELADARSELTLLEAGSRTDEIAAARARLSRLQEEARYLENLQQELSVSSPVAGWATTPRLKEQVGRYLEVGELICIVEDRSALRAEIALPEGSVERVRVEQPVRLKARGLPYQTFHTQVERIAPVAASIHADSQTATAPSASKTVTVSCLLQNDTSALRPGMTGYARISTGRRPIGHILGDRALRFLRTEFWW